MKVRVHCIHCARVGCSWPYTYGETTVDLHHSVSAGLPRKVSPRLGRCKTTFSRASQRFFVVAFRCALAKTVRYTFCLHGFLAHCRAPDPRAFMFFLGFGGVQHIIYASHCMARWIAVLGSTKDSTSTAQDTRKSSTSSTSHRAGSNGHLVSES